MKKLLLLACAFCLFSTTGFADPISDGTYKLYKSGWFGSSGTPCATVCRKAGGAYAESEKFLSTVPANKKAYVCKVRTVDLHSRVRGQSYGTNFDSSNYRHFCFVPGLDLKVKRAKRFQCLCVFKVD